MSVHWGDKLANKLAGFTHPHLYVWPLYSQLDVHITLRGRATGETVFTTAATFSQRPAQMIVLTHQYLDHLLHYSSDLKVIKVTVGK